MAVRVGFEPTTTSAIPVVTDSTLLTTPNLPSVPPTIARYCTLRLGSALGTKDYDRLTTTPA